jgi:murein L,D-transpeptidase YafK
MEKFSISLLSAVILFFTIPVHSKQDTSIKQISSPRLWTLNSSTLSGINSIPKGSASQSTNEKTILEIINLIQDDDLLKATKQAKKLTETTPNYALAQLLYSDLLRLHIPNSLAFSNTEIPVMEGDSPSNQAIESATSILAAQQELSFRLKASSNKPLENSFPRHIISLGNQYRQLLVADTKIGRIFIFDIQRSNKSTSLELKHSFFMTIGDQGAGKMIEGDKKTPLGIYQLLNRVPQNLLTDLYGLGAIQTNYPNPVDRILGKTGYGIWFHGTPSQVYVRYPFASDGCLVVSNDDMATVLASTSPQRTLVIIDDGIEWLQRSKNQSDITQHPIFKKLSESYIPSSGESPRQSLNSLYEGGFKWEYRLLRLIQTNKSVKQNFKVTNISVIEWTNGDPYTMVEFDFQLNSESKVYRVRQYWMPNQDNWRIVRESIF